jgi:hypothetical protein
VLFEYANNAHTTLAISISTGDLSMTVATSSGALFPTISSGQAFYCTLMDAATMLINEIVQVTARTGDVFTIVRAQQGTAAQNWVAGSIVSQLITAGDLDNFVQSAELPTFGTTTYPVTFNDSGSGAASGTTFDGSVARTISSNTIGALATGIFGGGNQSLTSNGYQIFPGGFVVQWGFASTPSNAPVAVTFPIPFPTGCFSVTCATSPRSVTSSLGTNYVSSVSQYGATLRFDQSTTGAFSGYWMAFGY